MTAPTKKGPGRPKRPTPPHCFTLRLEPGEVEIIDAVRGARSRNAWIRAVVMKAAMEP